MQSKVALISLAVLFVTANSCATPNHGSGNSSGDHFTTLAFTRPVMDESVAVVEGANIVPVGAGQKERQFIMQCHCYHVVGTAMKQKRKVFRKYYYAPKSDFDGVKLAVVGDDLAQKEVCKSRRLESIAILRVATIEGYPGSPILNGSWPSELPGIYVNFRRLVNGRYRVTFLPYESSTMAQVAESFSVDIDDSQWLALPCLLRGTNKAPASTVSVSNPTGEDETTEMMMFLNVTSTER